MHEFSLAEELLSQVLSAVKSYPLAAVQEVEVEIGLMKQVVPEALDLAWKAIIGDTQAAGAILHQIPIEIVARCEHCRRTFPGRIDWYQCPDCHLADVEILQGHEIILKSITLDTIQDCTGEKNSSDRECSESQ